MRKTLLIVSLIAAFSLGVDAQTKENRLGVKVGPTLDWASAGSTAAHNDGLRLGFNVGLVYDHYFTNNIAVSSGVNLSYLRMKYTFTDRRFVDDFLEKANVSVSRRLKTTNVEIPLKAKLRFDVLDLFAAYVEAGGALGFNVRDLAKDSYSFYWVSSDDETYVDRTDQYRLLQLSMVFGLGAEYEISHNLSVFAQLTFDHSFSNAFVSSLEKLTGSVLRSNYAGLEVGVMF